MIRQTVPTNIRQLADDEVECILSTGALARDGHILVPQGADLAGYRANPIVLWQHDANSPVGTASAITVHHDRIAAKVRFAPAGVSAIADEVRALVKSGVVRSLSVGFDPKDGTPLDPKRPRGGQKFTSWELLECSFVSVPADPGATVTARVLRSGTMTKHLQKLEELVHTAARHHDDCGRAMDRGNDVGAERAHAKLGRCLRDAQRCFRDIHAEAALADLQNNQLSQLSDGMGSGTSGGGRAVPPTLRERLAAVLQLSRPYVPDGGAVGVAAVRELEFARARAHVEACARAGAFWRAPSRAERQLELARLARDY